MGRFSFIKSLVGDSRDIKANEINQLICLLSLCTFTFLCDSAIRLLLFDNDKTKYQDFQNSRKEEISNFVIRSLLNDKTGGCHEK